MLDYCNAVSGGVVDEWPRYPARSLYYSSEAVFIGPELAEIGQ